MEPEPFALGDEVQIICSGETGMVIGLARYLDSKPNALIRYRAADGRAVEQWWNLSALQSPSETLS